MSDRPAYYAWFPTLDKKKDGASILLTRGSHERPPAGGRNFFEAVLDASGIDGDLAAWGVQPFITSYFSNEKWQECWDAKLLLSDAKIESGSKVVRAAVYVEPDDEGEPSLSLPVRVLADFTRRREADECRAELKEQAANAKWNEIHYERYALRDVGAKHKQLLIDVATRKRDQLDDEVLKAARQVIATCERLGGRTSSAELS